MKKILAIAFISAGTFLGTSSFTTPTSDVFTDDETSTVDFIITNNTSAEFKYCVNGGHNTINSGSTRSFSYYPGQDFNLIEGSSCGKPWFEVSTDMNGKKYKLTDLLQN